jgi:hypothetical protein
LKGAASVSISASDALSGVVATYYKLDGGNATAYTSAVSITGDGQHTIDYWSVDAAGNVEQARTLVVKIDGAAPSVTITANPMTIKLPKRTNLVPVTVSGRVTDSVSGVDLSSARYSVVDEYGQVQPGGAVTLAADGSYSFTVQLDARRNKTDRNGRTYTIKVEAFDRVGNVGSGSVMVTAS